jgi:tetratricopeptide (TPR) repeat protein
LEVLEEEDELDPAARRGLKRYGESAYRQILDVAREHEAEKRHESALETYDGLITILERMERFGLRDFTVEADLHAERDDVLDGLARYRYAQGIASEERKEWLDAIHWWERAREARDGWQDTADRIASAYTSLADVELADRQYPAAVEHYEASNEWKPDPKMRGWAGAIRAAMGRYYLREGGCRQAVEVFEAAEPDVTNDPRLVQDLATARDCAEVELVVFPFDQSPGTSIEGTDMGTLVADRLSEALERKGSRYLRLIDATTATVSSLHSMKGHRYDVRGRVSQLRVDRPEPEVRELSTKGTTRDLCPGIEGYYSTRDEYCEETFRVAYEERRERVEMRISASVRVVQPSTSEQVLTRSLEASALRATVYATDFQHGGEPVETGLEPSKTVAAIDREILELQQRPPELPSDSVLVAEAAENLAAEAAVSILAGVDKGETAEEPRVLANIRSPLTSPEDIEISPGRIISQPEEAPKPPEPPPEPEKKIIIIEKPPEPTP